MHRGGRVLGTAQQRCKTGVFCIGRGRVDTSQGYFLCSSNNVLGVWGGRPHGMEQPRPGASVLPCDGTVSKGTSPFFNYGFIKAVEKTIAVQGQRTLQVSL